MVGCLVITILNEILILIQLVKYTFISGRASNTVDYILVSAHLFSSIYSFSVNF